MADSSSKPIHTDKNTSEPDVDLGVLFNLLSRFFSKIVNGIVYLFQAFFHLLVVLLIYFKKHLLKFVIAAVVGAILGGIYQYRFKDSVFTSSMTVQANYESIIQLYKDIEYCQSLIDENDNISLADFFKIDSLDASSLKKIDVMPYTNDNQIALAYNDFISKLDTAVVKNVDFDKFSRNIPKEEFLYHIVIVESTNRTLFSRLEQPILNSLAQNPYYSKMMETEVNNLKSQEKVLDITMVELDSLRQFYKELAINESQKANGEVSLYLGNTKEDNREIVVFDKYIQANIDLIDVRSEMNKKNKIINVVSSFDKTGSRVKGWYRNTMLVGFVGGILLVLFYLIVFELNRYLKNQEQKLNALTK